MSLPLRSFGSFCLTLILLLPVLAQQPAPSPGDSQALTILQRAITALGSSVPADSVATGSITTTAGSEVSTGTIRVLTRGTNQTSEEFTLPASTSRTTYSDGSAALTADTTSITLPFQRAVTSQSIIFPLPFLANALTNKDVSIEYVAAEMLNDVPSQHIRLRNSFASQPDLQAFADYTVFDLWVDAASALPQRISFVRRDGSGAIPRIPVDTYFGSYKTTSGFTYPAQVNVSVNGTPWAAITISSISFNIGLTDSSFSIR